MFHKSLSDFVPMNNNFPICNLLLFYFLTYYTSNIPCMTSYLGHATELYPSGIALGSSHQMTLDT